MRREKLQHPLKKSPGQRKEEKLLLKTLKKAL
jgi:hypothetical protein